MTTANLWVNTGLAAAGFLAALGSINKMRVGETRPCVIGAVLLIALGLAGQCLSLLKAEWHIFADTALYGGVLALLVASQRLRTWFLERWANPIASAIAIFVAAVFLLGLFSGCAHAQEPREKPVFLVALDKLDGDKMYARTVVLAVPNENGSHFGVILNLPSKYSMGEVFADHEPSKAITDPLFVGGPDLDRAVFAMARSSESPGPGSREIFPGVWLIIQHAVIDAFIERSPNAARYYQGLVRWHPGQLAEEIRKGWFMVRPADPAKLFLPDPSKLYDELVTPNRKAPLET